MTHKWLNDCDLWLSAHGEHHETTSWLFCCQIKLRLSHPNSTHANQPLIPHTHIPKQCLGSVSLPAFTVCCIQTHTNTHTLNLHLPPPQKSVGSLDCKRERKTNYFTSNNCCIMWCISKTSLEIKAFYFCHYFDNFFKKHNMQHPHIYWGW